MKVEALAAKWQKESKRDLVYPLYEEIYRRFPEPEKVRKYFLTSDSPQVSELHQLFGYKECFIVEQSKSVAPNIIARLIRLGYTYAQAQSILHRSSLRSALSNYAASGQRNLCVLDYAGMSFFDRIDPASKKSVYTTIIELLPQCVSATKPLVTRFVGIEWGSRGEPRPPGVIAEDGWFEMDIFDELSRVMGATHNIELFHSQVYNGSVHNRMSQVCYTLEPKTVSSHTTTSSVDQKKETNAKLS